MNKLNKFIFKKYDLSWYIIIIQGILLITSMLLEITPDIYIKIFTGYIIFWIIGGVWNKRIVLDPKIFNLGYSVVILLYMSMAYMSYNLSEHTNKSYYPLTMTFMIWFMLFERENKK